MSPNQTGRGVRGGFGSDESQGCLSHDVVAFSPPSTWSESSASFLLVDGHVIEKSPRLDQIGGLEALCKSVAHRYQKIVRLPGASPAVPQTRKARRRWQLQRERPP